MNRTFGRLGGSFFCNSTRDCVPLCGQPNGAEPLPCIDAGYGSLAQTPIRHGGQMVGTIHLADPEPGKFPLEIMTFVETVAPLVGEAVRRFAVTDALRESEGRFRSMFERNNSVMLLIHPESGALVDANPAAAAFYGYTRERMREMNIDDLGWLPRGSVETLRRLAQCEHQNFFVFPHRLANSETRTVEIHADPIEVRGESLLFTTVCDVSDRKLLERQILDAGEEERQRIGQDLHDSVGGKLTGAALMSKALAQGLSAKGLAEAGLAEEIVQCINQAIIETRTVARGLCPVELSDSGLTDGLEEFARQTGRHSGVQCTFHQGEGVEIRSLLVSSHLFRIAQEAVSNALRHAQPRRISVHLGRLAEDVILEIRNDGLALPPTPKLATGLGLRTMRHRAEIIGAQLNVKPGETGGTVVWCLLPAATLAAHEAASSHETRH